MKKLFYLIAVLFVLVYIPTPAPTKASTSIEKNKTKKNTVLVEKATELSKCLTDLKLTIDSNEKK